ncbi:sensor histidine kinase [Flavihumibacter sp. CACIAM 22H1]|uniref:sensor histidine kinase n=1 Tax=Flavihumibacter sp. CACIAM 22H1 TaxID=1812911 RepID=UPI000AFDB30C|nr:sensor histidine kinase [Flavihumibacter sp. CACIAM 22H1]
MIQIQPTSFRKASRLPWTGRRILFILSYGLLTYTIVRLLNDVISDTRFWKRPLSTNLIEITGCLLISFIFEWLVTGFSIQVEEENKEMQNPGSSLKQFLSLAVYLEIIVICFIFPLAAFTDDGLQAYDVVILGFAPVSMWLFYYSVRQGQSLIRYTYEQKLALEKITKDRLENELQYLRAQFHPHFLFNALNTIYFQVEESNTEARYTIEKLAELLRYQLYDQDNKVKLDQELRHLSNFIELQKQRSSERLKLDLHFPDTINNQFIYPLLLLPLVENAFKYVGGDPFIKIDINLVQNQLNCRISNAIPPIAHQHKAGGIGLENLRKRLALLYPGKHQLLIEKSIHIFTADLQLIL